MSESRTTPSAPIAPLVVSVEMAQARTRQGATEDWALAHMLLLANEGSFTHYVEGRRVLAEPGSVVYVAPGKRHSYDPAESADGWVILIDDAAASTAELVQPSVVMLGRSIEIARALVLSLTEPSLLPASASERLRGQFARTLLALVQAAANAQQSPALAQDSTEYQRLVSDFRRELELSFNTERSVSNYAHRIGCSQRTLSRACNAAAGQSPREIIDARVVFAAARLLADTETPVVAIAAALGFTNSSNFSRFFRRHVGVTPGQYRSDQHALRENPHAPRS